MEKKMNNEKMTSNFGIVVLQEQKCN